MQTPLAATPAFFHASILSHIVAPDPEHKLAEILSVGVLHHAHESVKTELTTHRLHQFSIRCQHGLNGGCCAACADRLRSGKTSPNRDKYLSAFSTYSGPENSESHQNSATLDIIGFDEEVEDFLATEEDAKDEETAREKTEKRFVTLPVKPWVDTRREDFEKLYGPLLSAGRAWEEAYRQREAKRKAETLAEYAARHKNDEAATVPHLPYFCPECLMWVTCRHNRATCAAKLLAERQRAAELGVAICQAREQRYRRELLKHGLGSTYSSEDFDLDIIEARGRDTGETITEFDKKLWNKSPRAKCKWRIR